jgi:hypothetical protein
MPSADYGVRADRVVETRAEEATDTPHFQIKARGVTPFSE